MVFKCKGSLPHANLSWRSLVTSASIYIRKNNKKFAALANKGNPHIIMCVTVVHFHIPRGGDERAPGCWKHHARPDTLEELQHQGAFAVPAASLSAGACCPLWLGPRSQQAIKVVFCSTQSQTRALLMSPSWLRARKERDTLICCHLCQQLDDLDRGTAPEDIRDGCRNPVVTPWFLKESYLMSWTLF